MLKRKEIKVIYLLEFIVFCELVLVVFEKLWFLLGLLFLWLLESSFFIFMLIVFILILEKLIVDCYMVFFLFCIWVNECLMNLNFVFGWFEVILYSSKILCLLKVWRLFKVGLSSMMIIFLLYNEYDRKNECNEYMKFSIIKFFIIILNWC